jgi:hypothetical protein
MKLETALNFIVGFLAIAGIGGSIYFLFSGGNNEGFQEYPTITNLHVLPGVIYLALAPLQFLKSIRSSFGSYHKWIGRLLSLIALVAGSGAMFLGIITPYSGIPEQIVIAIFGSLFLFSTVRGFFCARARNFNEHREWMIRAFSIGLSIATMRLIFVPMLIVIGESSREEAEFFSIVSFTIAFALHSGFAEYWIRHTRSTTSASATPSTT